MPPIRRPWAEICWLHYCILCIPIVNTKKRVICYLPPYCSPVLLYFFWGGYTMCMYIYIYFYILYNYLFICVLCVRPAGAHSETHPRGPNLRNPTLNARCVALRSGSWLRWMKGQRNQGRRNKKIEVAIGMEGTWRNHCFFPFHLNKIYQI